MSSNTPAERPTAHGFLKRLLPVSVYVFVREVFMAVFTPTAHAAKRGYFRSAVTRSVTGGKNAPAPWMTFPLVSYLESRSFDGTQGAGVRLRGLDGVVGASRRARDGARDRPGVAGQDPVDGSGQRRRRRGRGCSRHPAGLRRRGPVDRRRRARSTSSSSTVVTGSRHCTSRPTSSRRTASSSSTTSTCSTPSPSGVPRSTSGSTAASSGSTSWAWRSPRRSPATRGAPRCSSGPGRS